MKCYIEVTNGIKYIQGIDGYSKLPVGGINLVHT